MLSDFRHLISIVKQVLSRTPTEGCFTAFPWVFCIQGWGLYRLWYLFLILTEEDVISLSPLPPVPQSFSCLHLQEKRLLLTSLWSTQRKRLCMGNKLFFLNWGEQKTCVPWVDVWNISDAQKQFHSDGREGILELSGWASSIPGGILKGSDLCPWAALLQNKD